MFALNMAVTNWGISGWSIYLLVTVAVGLATHRFGLPLLFRSAFYPMLGEYTWGWLGDGIDTMAILVTFCGLCTSLGLATFQLLAAFRFMGWFSFDSISDGVAVDADTKFVQISIIWVITLMSTISVVSGINGGIRVLSYVAVALGFFLLILILALDDTTFLLNLTAQEVGVYLQRSVLELNFWTDAFGQLRSGNGRSVDGKSAEMWWMDAWTVFYQAWCVCHVCRTTTAPEPPPSSSPSSLSSHCLS
jgi:choline/glycine/proline betaine transport protein